jgi:branched-subunit amino acid ABC-type transport system permease component
MLPQLLLSGLSSGLILCLFALGLSLAFGVLHIVDSYASDYPMA